MFLETSVIALESEKDLEVNLDKSDLGEDVTVVSTKEKDSEATVVETEENPEVVSDEAPAPKETETEVEVSGEGVPKVEVEVKIVNETNESEEDFEGEAMTEDEILDEEDEVKAEEVAMESLEPSPLNNLEISINEDLSGIELDIEELGAITIDIKKLDSDIETAEVARKSLEVQDAEGVEVEGEDLPIEGEPVVNEDSSAIAVESADAILNIISRSWGLNSESMRGSVATESLTNGHSMSDIAITHGALGKFAESRSVIVQEGLKETFKRARNVLNARGRAANLRDDLIEMKSLVKEAGKELKPSMKPITSKLASSFYGSPTKVTMRNIAKQVDDTLLSVTYLQKAVKDIMALVKLAGSVGDGEKGTAKLIAKAKEISERSPLKLKGFMGTASEPLVGNEYYSGGSRSIAVGDVELTLLHVGERVKLKPLKEASIETGSESFLTDLLKVSEKTTTEFGHLTNMFNDLYSSKFFERRSGTPKGVSKYITEQAFVLIAIYLIISKLNIKTTKAVVNYAGFSIKNK